MKLKPRMHRLLFFVNDAWDEWCHSPGVNLLAVSTLAAALFLAGLVSLVLGNVEVRVEHLRDDVRVRIFLLDSADDAARSALERELRGMQGVARVEYVDKQAALERYSEWAGEMARLAAELETNPLPASFEVYLQPGPAAEAVGTAIAQRTRDREGVEEARFDRETLHRLEALLDLARIGGTGLGVLVFSAVVFVMASVLRLAVYARRNEIEIMLLVGATPGFVRGPFLVAGFATGLLSSLLALGLVEGARRGALAYAGDRALVLLDLVAERPMGLEQVVLLVAVGLLVSLTGAWFAVRRAV
jgi:cell division transport system permease protein